MYLEFYGYIDLIYHILSILPFYFLRRYKVTPPGRGTCGSWHSVARGRGAEDQVRAEAETLRSMHHANLHRVVESFEDAAVLLEPCGSPRKK